MSTRPLTMVFGYRDREIDRVKRSLESLSFQTCKDFHVNFVDYGSQTRNARAVRELTDSLDFCRYFYSDTRGQPWNRSRALNIGVRRSRTKFVLTTDVDMIFAPNFVEEVLKAQDGQVVVQCAPRWLPEAFAYSGTRVGSWDTCPIGDRAQKGGCQCVPYDAMVKIGGFDESCEYWGAEDRDLHKRLLRFGLSERWVNNSTSIYHQWHPSERGNVPRGYAQRWIEPYLQRIDGEITRNNSSWGHIVSRVERKINELLPGPYSGTIVDWGTLLVQLTQATSGTEPSPYWLLTDDATSLTSTNAAQNGYQSIIIESPSSGYLLHQDTEKESEIEHCFARAMEGSPHRRTLRPKVIVVDVPTFWRLSRNLLHRLLDILAPGGLLAIANLRQPHLPFSWRCWRTLLPALLAWLEPRLWRVSLQAMHQCREVLAALREPNDLRDSLYLARVDVTGITDFSLDFPVTGGAAVFLKSI